MKFYYSKVIGQSKIFACSHREQTEKVVHWYFREAGRKGRAKGLWGAVGNLEQQ